MSAFITLNTPMVDEECLIEAIVEQGFDESKIVRSNELVALRGWRNGQKANIVLRKEDTGDRYNDIGFRLGAAGYVAILSDDHHAFGRNWLQRINTSYQTLWQAKQERMAEEERRRLEEERLRIVEAQRQAVHERAKKLGYRVKESKEGDTIRLVLVKRTY